jgi:hypothetical protein
VSQDQNNEWLAVIGKSLAYLCLKQAEKAEPTKMVGILPKVNFLKGLGLTQNDAAEAVGSSPESVAAMLRQAKSKKGTKAHVAKKSRR